MKQILILLLLPLAAAAQLRTETIRQELSFEKKTTANALMIFNINGDVSVTGYDGETVQVEAVKKIAGKTESRLQLGWESLTLGTLDRADTLMLFIKSPCHAFGRQKHKLSTTNGWGYDSNNNEEPCNYDYEISYAIKVPRRINVYASTINDGDIKVEGVAGTVATNNVNGSIRLHNISGQTIAHTINGDVDLDYQKNPASNCRYYTLNGNINANFRKGLAADISFKSFNGEFFTNLPELRSLPAALDKENTPRGSRYKINGNRFQSGNGGTRLDFETFNGNVYLKEIN